MNLSLRIRQRNDALLHEQILKERQVASALALRLKLMAGLNITEKRIPKMVASVVVSMAKILMCDFQPCPCSL